MGYKTLAKNLRCSVYDSLQFIIIRYWLERYFTKQDLSLKWDFLHCFWCFSWTIALIQGTWFVILNTEKMFLKVFSRKQRTFVARLCEVLSDWEKGKTICPECPFQLITDCKCENGFHGMAWNESELIVFRYSQRDKTYII